MLDYLLALKRKQGPLYAEVRKYFSYDDFLNRIKNKEIYRKTQEKAHGQIEIREYYQAEDVGWLHQKKTEKVCEVLKWKKDTDKRRRYKI